MNAPNITPPPPPGGGPGPTLPFRAVLEDEFERLRRRLLLAALWDDPGPDAGIPIRRAANEAAVAAWDSGYPLLTFPLLFEEFAGRFRGPAARPPDTPARRERALEAAT